MMETSKINEPENSSSGSVATVSESETEQIKPSDDKTEEVPVDRAERPNSSRKTNPGKINLTRGRPKNLKSNQHHRNKMSFNSPTWYMDPCFSRYWNHYNKVMQWCGKHFQTIKYLQQNQAQCLYQNQTPMCSSVSTQLCDPKYWRAYFTWLRNPGATSQKSKNSGSNRAFAKKKRRREKRRVKSRGHESVEDMSLEEGDANLPDEEFEMEITEEMKEFFAHSERHRQERDAQKGNSVCDDEETRINMEDLNSSSKLPTSEAPREQPGLRREQEMKTLYGNGSPMIQGMETALQMTYDRNIDLKQPKFWPNIPLKITFS